MRRNSDSVGRVDFAGLARYRPNQDATIVEVRWYRPDLIGTLTDAGGFLFYMPYDANKNELEILEFWKKNKIFEKSVSERPENKPYVFYDGPPFATGLPHYGHIVASLMKDIVPRYWTMNGRRVERRWGWDCHGLPIENIIEKELNLATKKDIEAYGIYKFNEACRATVLKYADEWKKFIPRIGRWVDMGHDYKTMDLSYMESVWWVFKQLWDKDLIYEGHKVMHVCPRCVTPLSNFEVTQGYKEVKDISTFVKFKVKNLPEKLGLENDVFVLAWTTTPWTLPGNVLLAVGPEIEYSAVKIEGETGTYILARERREKVFNDKKYEVVKEYKGAELADLMYEPLFPYYSDTPNAFRVVTADFVSTNDGTGVVHIAPAFGEDDYNVGKREKIPLVQHVNMDGTMKPEVTDFAGMDVKPKDEPSKMDIEVIKWLAKNGKLFAKEKITHSYPHCWRCDTPLLNYATSSWFVNVTPLKKLLLQNNEQIHWVPDAMKDGRFGKWLEGAHDWAISRNRFWGTPLPVWRCESEGTTSKEQRAKCKNIVLGSVAELEKLSGKKVTDLHKHIVDTLVLKCGDCGGEMHRVSEVLDCWFESGSMPYGELHYPFENKAKFEAGFPAEFIAEGQDQTRGWFYTLHVLATALTRGPRPAIPTETSTPAFRNVIVNGIVLAEDGKKMSKRLKNYPDPMVVIEKYGADAMRYYFATSPVMYAEPLNFSEVGVREMYNKVINMVSNILVFYETFASEATPKKKIKMSTNVLDQWILAKLHFLIQDVTTGMNEYLLAEAARPILSFIDELSTWYVRRSRERFKGDDEADKQAAIATLHDVLLTLSKVMAPFTPFIAEKIYQVTRSEEQGASESVHLEMWPQVNKKMFDEKILEEMKLAREIVERGLFARKLKNIPVRQPLGELRLGKNYFMDHKYLTIIQDELNIKKIVLLENEKEVMDEGKWFTIREFIGLPEETILLSVDLVVSDQLKKEGLVREIIRTINLKRKDAGLTRHDEIAIAYETDDVLLKEAFRDHAKGIQLATLTKTVEAGGITEMVIDERKLKLDIRRV